MKITKVPATIKPLIDGKVATRRAAGYARVSTDHEEQESSFETQVSYYTDYIKSRHDLEFVGVYTDEGVSAVSTAKRDGFNKMVADALAGNIDYIITKSVSRFARNTVDSLSTIRKLKEKGVEVFFEKENISTFGNGGEMLLSVMAIMAQEESRNISENVKWGKRKRMADGEFSLNYKHFLGYEKGENGRPVIIESQAEIVRRIYALFIEGLTPYQIANRLTAESILSPMGKEKWYDSTVLSILTNEKYKGDALLQKTYIEDFLSKKQILNTGDVPQHYITESHEAIIPPALFDLVQVEIERRKNRRHSGVGIFASKLKCSECGGWYGAKEWHSTSKYSRTVYQCNNKYKLGCSTPHLYEEKIKRHFLTEINKMLNGDFLKDYRRLAEGAFFTETLEDELQKSETETSVVEELIKRHVHTNMRSALDQSEYRKQYNALAVRHEEAKAKCGELQEQIKSKKSRELLFNEFIKTVKQCKTPIEEFDEKLWVIVVDYMEVGETIRIVFKCGL